MSFHHLVKNSQFLQDLVLQLLPEDSRFHFVHIRTWICGICPLDTKHRYHHIHFFNWATTVYHHLHFFNKLTMMQGKSDDDMFAPTPFRADEGQLNNSNNKAWYSNSQEWWGPWPNSNSNLEWILTILTPTLWWLDRLPCHSSPLRNNKRILPII